jgi:hypothetical protein
LTFSVAAVSSPGMQWPEARIGVVRPHLTWVIDPVGASQPDRLRL